MAKKKSKKTKKKVKEIMQKKDDESLHVRSVRPQSKNVIRHDISQQQQARSRLESGNDTDIDVVSRKSCPNKETIEKMSSSLGQLFRVGTLA